MNEVFISNFYYIFGGWSVEGVRRGSPWTRSVVGVRAPGVSVFGLPYYTSIFCVYAHVNTRTYARICFFVMHSHKFLYVKHRWSNKGHYISGNKKGFTAKFAYY